MGRKWTNETQEAFLRTFIPEYADAVAQDGVNPVPQGTATKASHYRRSVHTLWFKKFPERLAQFPHIPEDEPLTAEQQAVVNNAVSKRKDQLNSWFTRQVIKESRSTTRDFDKLVRMADKDPTQHGRAHQQVEIYQMNFVDDFKLELEEALAGVDLKKEKDKAWEIRRKVVGECWKRASNDIKSSVLATWEMERTKMDKKRQEAKEMKKQRGSGAMISRTPEEYDQALKALPGVMKAFLAPIAENTGWTFLVLAGGPNGREDRRICTDVYSFGEKSAESNLDFPKTANFKENVLKPFGVHVAKCYPQHIRAARVVRSEDDMDNPEQPDQPDGGVQPEPPVVMKGAGGVDAPWKFTTQGVVSRAGLRDSELSDSSDSESESSQDEGARTPMARSSSPFGMVPPTSSSPIGTARSSLSSPVATARTPTQQPYRRRSTPTFDLSMIDPQLLAESAQQSLTARQHPPMPTISKPLGGETTSLVQDWMSTTGAISAPAVRNDNSHGLAGTPVSVMTPAGVPLLSSISPSTVIAIAQAAINAPAPATNTAISMPSFDGNCTIANVASAVNTVISTPVIGDPPITTPATAPAPMIPTERVEPNPKPGIPAKHRPRPRPKRKVAVLDVPKDYVVPGAKVSEPLVVEPHVEEPMGPSPAEKARETRKKRKEVETVLENNRLEREKVTGARTRAARLNPDGTMPERVVKKSRKSLQEPEGGKAIDNESAKANTGRKRSRK